MPSISPEQHQFMEAVKHNKRFARKVGVPQKVGRDFVAADKASDVFDRAALQLRMHTSHRGRNGRFGARMKNDR